MNRLRGKVSPNQGVSQIIAISSGGLLAPRRYLQLASALGVDRAIAKPFTQSEMLDNVRELLGKP